jgi:hypothetical protein
MKKTIVALVLLFSMISCGGDHENSSLESENPNQTDSITTEVEEIPIDLTLESVGEFPHGCDVKGTVVDVHTWSDVNGTNYFIRTMGDYETKSIGDDQYSSDLSTQYLYAFHYAQYADGEIKLLKETTDFIKECEFDIVMGHQLELDAISLTDIDQDEIAEISFIYRLACTSDVSPATQKLIMLENGDKYPIRGNTEVMGEGGNYEAGEEFDSAPEGFLEHAVNLWNKNLTEYDFDL